MNRPRNEAERILEAVIHSDLARSLERELAKLVEEMTRKAAA